MNKVYFHEKLAVDKVLGWVSEDGTVYESRFGPDRKIGRVDLETGRVYEARVGPDKLIGHIQPDTGRVFATRLGPDEYLGEVKDDGRLYYALPLARDPYLGQVEGMTSRLHGGAAYLLLVIPRFEEIDKSG